MYGQHTPSDTCSLTHRDCGTYRPLLPHLVWWNVVFQYHRRPPHCYFSQLSTQNHLLLLLDKGGTGHKGQLHCVMTPWYFPVSHPRFLYHYFIINVYYYQCFQHYKKTIVIPHSFSEHKGHNHHSCPRYFVSLPLRKGITNLRSSIITQFFHHKSPEFPWTHIKSNHNLNLGQCFLICDFHCKVNSWNICRETSSDT